MIILSQRIDFKSEYEDIPYRTYHFPKRYRNQIHSGDRFIYYQGSRQKKDHRYYFGCGVVGVVEPDATGESLYAQILEGKEFPIKVPIYNPMGNGFIESIGYETVRNKPVPSWQNSIRKISEEAFYEILRLAKVRPDFGMESSYLETEKDALKVLQALNERYEGLSPTERLQMIQKHVDRGSGITNALKSLLGANCQICGWCGFTKKNEDKFIEAHHVVQLSEKREGSLCIENIILLCPNCHREVHYGNAIQVADYGDFFDISLSNKNARIRKNSTKYLAEIAKQNQ